MRILLSAVLLSTALVAQTPQSCPADRPVDDLIADVHHQQSKMKHRNSNPFPDVACVLGWCRQSKRSSGNEPSPKETPAPASQPQAPADSNSSSSKSTQIAPVDACDAAMESALEAAHNTDVGDFNFKQGNYGGALMRYQDAEKQKPGDIALEVRLGRTFEKLHQNPQAVEHYEAAAKLTGPEKWTKEAQSALARLKR